MSSPPIPGSETLYEGRFRRFLIKDDWEFTQRNNCQGLVGIIAMTEDKKVLFVEQMRIPVGRTVIEFPAGLVGDSESTRGEDFSIAAARELLEETGYEAAQVEFITKGPSLAASVADIIHLYHAKGLKRVHDGGGDETEDIKVHEIPLDEVESWLAEKHEDESLYVDPKVYAGLYFLRKSELNES